MNEENTIVEETKEETKERATQLEETEKYRLSYLVEKQKACALGLELIKAKFEEGKRMLDAANKELGSFQNELSGKYGEDANADLATGKLTYTK